MIVCSCNVISDHEVRTAAASNPSGGMSHVYRTLGRKPDCGRCKRTIKEIACLRPQLPQGTASEAGNVCQRFI